MNNAFIPYFVSGDSEVVVKLLSNFNYKPEQTNEILAKYKEFFCGVI